MVESASRQQEDVGQGDDATPTRPSSRAPAPPLRPPAATRLTVPRSDRRASSGAQSFTARPDRWHVELTGRCLLQQARLSPRAPLWPPSTDHHLQHALSRATALKRADLAQAIMQSRERASEADDDRYAYRASRAWACRLKTSLLLSAWSSQPTIDDSSHRSHHPTSDRLASARHVCALG